MRGALFYAMQITRDIFRFRNHLSPSLQQRVTRRLSLVEQELLTLLQHLSPPRFFVGFVMFTSLICVVWVFWGFFFGDRCLSFCPFSCCHSIVCPFVLFYEKGWLPSPIYDTHVTNHNPNI